MNKHKDNRLKSLFRLFIAPTNTLGKFSIMSCLNTLILGQIIGSLQLIQLNIDKMQICSWNITLYNELIESIILIVAIPVQN